MQQQPTMTASAYRTLRETCGLSQQTAAPFHGVSYRSIQEWESGNSRVPVRIAEQMRALDLRISEGAHALVVTAGRPPRSAPPVLLVRWRTQDAYAAAHGANAASLPFGAYNAMLGRAISRLLIAGRPYTVEWAPEPASSPPE